MTVPGKLSDDLAPGTLNSILKQAQLKTETSEEIEEIKEEQIKEEEEN